MEMREIDKKGTDKTDKKDFSALLSGGEFSPCCGCRMECYPATCIPLEKFVGGRK